MHSIAIASLLAAAVTFTSAAPSTNRPRSAYYVCASSGFRGDCSVKPCASSWCPDYKPWTYEPVATKGYVCASNGFRGDCSVDPCAMRWCPDYKPSTYEPVGSAQPVRPVETPVAAKGYYVCASNGFRGDCSVDPCALSWCPDYKPSTYEPVGGKRVVRARQPAPAADPTVCPAGTGFFQSCSNGFRGCCKRDACGSSWCPDFKPGTYEPVKTTTITTPEVPVSKPGSADRTVCPPNTGYYQVCGTKFSGCCKTDACTLGYCPV